MSTLKLHASDADPSVDRSAVGRPQLCRRVSAHDLLAPESATQTVEAPRQTKDDGDDKKKSNNPSNNTAELHQEIECLGQAIDKLEGEKNALKMRLNEIEYFQKFQVSHCKKWLQANFDFDRKDSPDLLAGIFEDYLLQNDNLEPLPHQMIVKNSAKGKLRRDKLIQQRTQRRGVKRETKSASDAPAPKKTAANKTADSSESNNIWAIYNVFIPVDEMDLLFAQKPWQRVPKNWPKINTTSKSSAVQELLATQETFLEENAWAIWERNHWFPIKQENGRTLDEVKRLCQIHSRRKRRQAALKSGLEQISLKMHKSVEKSVLKQSIFSAESVESLLKRPRLWIPREGEGLVPQLEELDREEPDRNYYKFPAQIAAFESRFCIARIAGRRSPSSSSLGGTRTMETPQSIRETSSVDKMAHYLQRYEQLQQERARQRRQRRASMEFTVVSPTNNTEVDRVKEEFGDAAAFLGNRYDYTENPPAVAAVESDARHEWMHAADGEYESGEEAHHQNVFDLPRMDSFPGDEYRRQEQPFGDSYAEQEAFPDVQCGVSVASDEFVDAETYLEKNQLGGDDSFEQDLDLQAQWERQHESVLESESGRPSDFFEKRSCNMERVEFALDDEQSRNSFDDATQAGSILNPPAIRQQHPDRVQTARLDSSLSFSDTNTALSSGYDVHFDSTRQAYTPNSLKHLQEKSRRRKPLDVYQEETAFQHSAHHENDAHNATESIGRNRMVIPDVCESEDEAAESVEAMQRGPGVIRRALHEIDSLIGEPSKQSVLGQDAAQSRLRSTANDSGCEPTHSSPGVHDVVREFDISLETGLPLSRTTDSWGDDPEEEQHPVVREDQFESPSQKRESGSSMDSDVHRTRLHEHSEMDAVRETRFSSGSVLENKSQLHRINEEQSSSYSSMHTRETMSPSGGSQLRDARNPVSTTKEPVTPRLNPNSSVEQNSSGARGEQKRRSGSMKTSELVSTSHEDSIASTQQQNAKKVDAGVQFLDEIRKSSSGGIRKSEQSMRKYPVSSQSKMAGPSSEWRDDGLSENGYDAPSANVVKKTGHKANDYSSQQPHRNDVGTRRDQEQDTCRRIAERKSAKDAEVPHTAINPIQLSRRCRRLLCSVGETMTERIVFSNGGDSVGRICVSLLPLSTGCQQFAVSPAVLDLGPRASSSFHVTFTARTAGVAAGIFQFRGVGVDALFAPYEVLIEASVRRNLNVEEGDAPSKLARLRNDQRDRQVEELRRSKCINEVEIGPTFVKFEHAKTKRGDRTINASKVKITNNTEDTLPFKINCSHEHLKITPGSGVLPPASEAFVKILPVSRPFDRHSNGERLDVSARSVVHADNWAGSFTVSVGKKFSRVISFVFGREVMDALPPFDEIARSRHHISSQTDSFYYTKKRNRKGLYFHARAVECGSCNVGESHQVPVYICNGSNTPMTVFLQELMEPFSCFYTTTTIEPRKFIEVPVTFTPKVAGKVSTSLFAYSVTDKAVVTLVARGI